MRFLNGAGLFLAASLLVTGERLAHADPREDFFEAKIRPVLATNCFRCHNDLKTSGSLRIDSREKLLAGGESGPAIVPGKPEESLLIRAIQRQEDVSAMPPEKESALRSDQVVDFSAWIKAGAVWPETSARFETARHWSFEPIRDFPLPDVEDQAWVQTSIDAFVRARQEAAGVRPAPSADRTTLIRRATFDLTGLPPTPEEIEAFREDTSPRAFDSVIERLLESPAYGERWGRHWLDVVRYADTAGETADYPVPQAWRYRNYVIGAFNADKPYDEFLREQIAGDVLAQRGLPERYAERVTATGYLAISRRFGFDSENYQHLTIQDTIDTLGQSVLGISLGCARCHDHKFDAISMQDYYALYGIFDSSRYAFPGSEQKQKVRSLAPLLPPSASQPMWRAYQARIAELAGKLAAAQQPAPAAVLRSLNDIDGDFELQAPAAGGSNGVLVAPWHYRGNIAVTNAAQSPFKNCYPLGKVGTSVPSGSGEYRIEQAIYPRRSSDNCEQLYVNLDFRVAASDSSMKGQHCISLGGIGAPPALAVLISSEAISLQLGENTENIATIKPNEWHNLQLDLNLKQGTIAVRTSVAGSSGELSGQLASTLPLGSIELVAIDGLNPGESKPPAIEFDNLGIQETPIARATVESLHPAAPANDLVALTEQLQAVAGIDGDFELQTKDAPPVSPWNPGPNSVVALSANSQSPFRNIFAAGELGIHLPNRGEYDGFGLTLANVKPDNDGRLAVSFDFRCAIRDAGGDGSWRYYLGHGPGNSAAIELFFNGSDFVRRTADAKETVGPLVVGEWYQAQLVLDLKAKTYRGTLASRAGKTSFSGQFATGWDGTIDYSFIDSYGHLGGVRPSLDADNFVVGDKPLAPLDAPPVELAAGEREAGRTQIAEIRRQIVALQANSEQVQQELNTLLAKGPCGLTYGMAEGTPHNARIHLRGEPDQLGAAVPRGFIKALGGGPLPAETAGSGRLELAQWLTRKDNPLTARVMANRIWQYHFGHGLVKTPNDFGVRGLPPTHPELLDHLATQFIRSGWSIKAMHRLIMLSATYQESSGPESELQSADTETDVTDLYAAFPRRRLSAEEIRDAILAVSGELDRTPALAHPFPPATTWGFTQHGPFTAVYDHNQRSVYLMTQRLKRHPFLALFDGPDPNATTPERLTTTVSTQALFFLNDPFVHAKAEQWATRLLADSDDESARIERAWLKACGRSPTESECAEATDFLNTYRAELAATGSGAAESRVLAAYLRALFASNEFLHVD